MMFEEVHTCRHTYVQTNIKNTCWRGTADAEDAGSQSQKPMKGSKAKSAERNWESRGCKKSKPPKAA